jgi:hypothetical protein
VALVDPVRADADGLDVGVESSAEGIQGTKQFLKSLLWTPRLQKKSYEL